MIVTVFAKRELNHHFFLSLSVTGLYSRNAEQGQKQRKPSVLSPAHPRPSMEKGTVSAMRQQRSDQPVPAASKSPRELGSPARYNLSGGLSRGRLPQRGSSGVAFQDTYKMWHGLDRVRPASYKPFKTGS